MAQSGQSHHGEVRLHGQVASRPGRGSKAAAYHREHTCGPQHLLPSHVVAATGSCRPCEAFAQAGVRLNRASCSWTWKQFRSRKPGPVPRGPPGRAGVASLASSPSHECRYFGPHDRNCRCQEIASNALRSVCALIASSSSLSSHLRNERHASARTLTLDAFTGPRISVDGSTADAC